MGVGAMGTRGFISGERTLAFEGTDKVCKQGHKKTVLIWKKSEYANFTGENHHHFPYPDSG